MAALLSGTASALTDPLTSFLPVSKETYPCVFSTLRMNVTASPDKAFGGVSRFSSKSFPLCRFQKKNIKIEDDPWESFFQQLEKDLEKDTDNSNEEDITEEDVANLEKELDTLLHDLENIVTSDENDSELTNRVKACSQSHTQDDDDRNLVDKQMNSDGKETRKQDYHKGLVKAKECSDDDVETGFEFADDADGDFSDDDLEVPRTVSLQKWQIRKLAAAVELGRRKVNIKSLAAELKLDRDDVLYFLKSPPPELLIAIAESEENTDEDEGLIAVPEADIDTEATNDSLENSDVEEDTAKTRPTYGPRDWYKQKRIKKVNLLTLQRVFRQTKWPSNSMIESMVQATHLPRARILEWFEEERARQSIQGAPKQKAASRKPWKKPATNSFERV